MECSRPYEEDRLERHRAERGSCTPLSARLHAAPMITSSIPRSAARFGRSEAGAAPPAKGSTRPPPSHEDGHRRTRTASSRIVEVSWLARGPWPRRGSSSGRASSSSVESGSASLPGRRSSFSPRHSAVPAAMSPIDFLDRGISSSSGGLPGGYPPGAIPHGDPSQAVTARRGSERSHRRGGAAGDFRSATPGVAHDALPRRVQARVANDWGTEHERREDRGLGRVRAVAARRAGVCRSAHSYAVARCWSSSRDSPPRV